VKTHENKATCPHCGAAHDCASNVTGHTAPKPGDFTVCVRCGEASRFVTPTELRAATREDLEELEPEERRALSLAREFFAGPS
jgi:hypothetical protein